MFSMHPPRSSLPSGKAAVGSRGSSRGRRSSTGAWRPPTKSSAVTSPRCGSAWLLWLTRGAHPDPLAAGDACILSAEGVDCHLLRAAKEILVRKKSARSSRTSVGSHRWPTSKAQFKAHIRRQPKLPKHPRNVPLQSLTPGTAEPPPPGQSGRPQERGRNYLPTVDVLTAAAGVDTSATRLGPRPFS